jgi:hypothetical protein
MKKFLGIAILFMAMVSAAFASPTGSVTSWRFSNAEDDYLQPQWYKGVEFSKFFATVGFSNKADFGFATSFGSDFYLGVHYAGHIFRHSVIGYSEMKDKFANKDDVKFKSYDNIDFTANRPEHSFGVLIGIADMGLLVTVDTNYQTFRVTEDTQVNFSGVRDIKTGEQSYGDITPGIKWGMARDLTGNGIRPAVGVTFGIHSDIMKFEQYEVNGALPILDMLDAPYKIYGERIDHSDNSYELGLTFDLGGYNLISTEDGFKFSANLEYELSAGLYADNEYTWAETGGTITTSNYTKVYKKASVKGRVKGLDDYDTDVKDATHTITPSVAAGWNSDRIGLGAELRLPVEIRAEGHTKTISNYIPAGSSVPVGHKKYRDVGTYSETEVNFSPVLNLGAQFRAIPDKFFINIGGKIGLSKIGQTTTEDVDVDYDYTDNDKTTKTSSKKIAPFSSGTNTGLYAGMTFYFTNNVFLDAWTGLNGQNGFNIFGTSTTTSGSIAYFNGIILCLQF